jgi:hypothetical protein
MSLNDELPAYHETDTFETTKKTDLWEHVTKPTHPHFGDLSEITNCPKCAWDRCLISYSEHASAGIVTCRNPDCNFSIEI